MTNQACDLENSRLIPFTQVDQTNGVCGGVRDRPDQDNEPDSDLDVTKSKLNLELLRRFRTS